MVNRHRPRLEALRTVVKAVINAKTSKKKGVAIDEFDQLNNAGWHSCAIGSFLNDCGINVSQIASCRGTSNGEVVRALVKKDLVDEGGEFENNVYRNKVSAKKALDLLNRLISTKPCKIMTV